MSSRLGQFGIWRRVGEIDAGMAVDIEALGFGAIWVGGSPPGDLVAIEELLDATDAIPIVTGIVNMWRVPAGDVAQAHRRVLAAHPGRFLLGVGIGHPEATAEYEDPVEKIESYLDELVASGVEPEETVLAALGPRVLDIAARRTLGAHPYLTTKRHTAMARRLMGDGPLLAPEHFVAWGEGVDPVEAGAPTVARYLRLDNYRRNLRREGWTEEDLEGGGSEKLVRELVLSGEAGAIADSLRGHIDAGADHISIQVISGDVSEAHHQLAAELLPG